VLANEMAPRPHNSGHWTIDACATSQFEQLVRAICGLPLGAVDVPAFARMENLIGEEAKDWARYLADPTARLHLYGKVRTRPGRKMGHVTYVQKSGAGPSTS
jgi:5-(carboxyamino)imidazole ribonucleotide synthase